MRKQSVFATVAVLATSFAGSPAYSEYLGSGLRQNAPLQQNEMFRNNNLKSDALNPQPLPPAPPPGGLNKTRLQGNEAFRNNNLKYDTLNPQPLPPAPPPSGSLRTNTNALKNQVNRQRELGFD